MPDALNAVNLRHTAQSQPADPRHVQNSAGGYTFTVAPLERLRRFLVLGIDGGTYYATERELTKANAEVVLAWARDRPSELVDEVVSISTPGRAPSWWPRARMHRARRRAASRRGNRWAAWPTRSMRRFTPHLLRCSPRTWAPC